jgi:hypothetical protein
MGKLPAAQPPMMVNVDFRHPDITEAAFRTITWVCTGLLSEQRSSHFVWQCVAHERTLTG